MGCNLDPRVHKAYVFAFWVLMGVCMAAFTQEQSAAIIKAFTEKTRGRARCSGCQQNNFVLGDGIVYLPLHPSHRPPTLAEMMSGETQLPSIPIVCATCGNTQLYNVFSLGLGAVLGLRAKATNYQFTPTPVEGSR